MDIFWNDFATYFMHNFIFMREAVGALPLLVLLLPMFVLIELPFQILISLGITRHFIRRHLRSKPSSPFHPKISVILTCYSEGRDVEKAIYSFAHQEYEGEIEILAMVDGSEKNKNTEDAVKALFPVVEKVPKRTLRLVSKRLRGGRVSSLNTGLLLSTGTIILAFDGDTSADNDMIFNAVQHFRDPNVCALSGNIRVRNRNDSPTTHLQALEYCLGISAGRLGLSEFGIINNISGAFGVFRRSLLERIGGWDTGTAEDLDITTRIKGYLGRHPHLRIIFEPFAIAHTDGPKKFKELITQRFRWDGDLAYIYLRKYWRSFTPRILGWKNFLLYVFLGLGTQLMLPFVIVLFHVWLFLNYPLGHVTALLLMVYAVYTFFTGLFFLQYVLMVSRERKKDIALAPWVLLFPGYSFILRVMMVFFFLKEMVCMAHLDSSMAPWWVLRKGKF